MLKMSLMGAFMLFISAFSLQAQAQYPYQPSDQPQIKYPYPTQQYSSNYCYIEQNPHSWACSAWTFAGTQMFPLNQIDWKGQMEGEWQTLTYANPWTENVGAEFQMMVSAANPRIPTGVLNRETNQLMGNLSIKGNHIVWNNWRGNKLKSFDEATMISSPYEFKFSLDDGDDYQQSFVCHDFNRNNKHHLLCSWFVITLYPNGTYTYLQHGYFGFLKVGTSDQPTPPTNSPQLPYQPIPPQYDPYNPGQPPLPPQPPQVPPTQPTPPVVG
jgi:hypothetical protein